MWETWIHLQDHKLQVGDSIIRDKVPDLTLNRKTANEKSYLHQNFNKICLKADQNPNDRRSRLVNESENHVCRSL